MCGIFGSYNFNGVAMAADTARAMSRSIRHRGPDAAGFHSDEEALLGNQRLAILDLTTASNQPLYSDNQSIVVVQNGEIYNYIELRQELELAGARFETNGDTEVILRAFEQWGPNFVRRLNGMFAIAIYHRTERQLYLYRDRLGVKPLYIAGEPADGRVYFASEIKSILAAGWTVEPCLDAIAQFLALNYIPSPSTAFEGIRHLPPGCMAVLSRGGGLEISQYWRLADIRPEPDMSESEASSGLLAHIDDATRLRMRSDANFGAFLSGGLDSSTVVGFMSMYKADPIQTFSIGFEDKRFDESAFAAMAARRFGTMHRMSVMQPDAVSLWAKMIWHCDQPHGDVSFMPMLQVSALAAETVKMVLTGDGADELFAGYDKYVDFFSQNELGRDWEDDYARQSGLLLGDQPDLLLRGDLREAFGETAPYAQLSDKIRECDYHDPINRILLAETTTLLPGNNLVKPDRMAMAHSLEVRSPFLDYNLAEFAFRMPGSLKLREDESKWIYKRAVEPLLGSELTYRKKQMFTVPVGEWFRQRLSGLCRDLLLDGRLESRRLFDPIIVAQMLSDHIDGRGNYTRQLRALMSLEIWFRLFVDKDPAMLEATNDNAELVAA